MDLFLQFPGAIGLLYFCEDLFLVYDFFFHLNNLKKKKRKIKPSCVNIYMGPSSTAHWLDCAKTKAATFFSHKWNFNFSLRCLLNSPSSWPVSGKMRQVRVFALTSVYKFHCGHEFHLTQKPCFPAGTFQQAL